MSKITDDIKKNWHTYLICIASIAVMYYLKGQYTKGYQQGYRKCISDVERILSNIDSKNNAQVFNPYSK